MQHKNIIKKREEQYIQKENVLTTKINLLEESLTEENTIRIQLEKQLYKMKFIGDDNDEGDGVKDDSNIEGNNKNNISETKTNTNNTTTTADIINNNTISSPSIKTIKIINGGGTRSRRKPPPIPLDEKTEDDDRYKKKEPKTTIQSLFKKMTAISSSPSTIST